MLVGFLVSFGFIRLSTRLMRSPRVPWWPGSVVSDSGVHLHHLVFGIILMGISGTLGFWFFDSGIWMYLSAVLFGIGIGLTIDEFALFIHLDDVYWSTEGRTSIDATVLAVVAMMLLLLGVDPIGLDGDNAFEVVFNTVFGLKPVVFDTSNAATTIASVAILLTVLGLALACFAKQRNVHGTVGFFVTPVAIYGVMRLAKPNSPWARRFYRKRDPDKQRQGRGAVSARSANRGVQGAFRDAVGGSTSDVYQAKARPAGGPAEAAAGVRERAERPRERRRAWRGAGSTPTRPASDRGTSTSATSTRPSAPRARLRHRRGQAGGRGTRPHKSFPYAIVKKLWRARPDGHPLSRGARRGRRDNLSYALVIEEIAASTRAWRSRWRHIPASAPGPSTPLARRSRSGSGYRGCAPERRWERSG